MEYKKVEVESLDEIISADDKGGLKKARDLFKSVVQDILSSPKFNIENTVRNIGIKRPITTGESDQTKQVLVENVNIEKLLKNNSELVLKGDPKGLDTLIQKFNKSDNKSDEEYKNFIEKLVSLENYFDKSAGKGRKIEEVYDKITSSLKLKNENTVVSSSLSTFNGPAMFNYNRNEFKSIALGLQEINSVDSLSEEKKKEIEEWKKIFNILIKSGVWSPSKEVAKNIFSSLNSGSSFYIEVDWQNPSICNKLSIQQQQLLKNMEHEYADLELKKKCQKYIKSKTYGHEDDLFSILDAIAAVDLELCMKELDALTKSKEKEEKVKEDEKNEAENENNKNKIIIEEDKNEKDLEPKEKKCKDIKEQLKHRARLLGFNNSDAFCDVIDKISTEPIDEFKKFVKNCQDKFDVYQKDYGVIQVLSEQTENDETKNLLSEAVRKVPELKLDIVKYFYDEAKKQAKEILKQNKNGDKGNDNPKILAVEFVLDLMDKVDNKNLNTEISEELRFLVNGTKQLDEEDDFGFENLSSIVKSVASTRDLSEKLFDSNLATRFYNLLGKINNDYSKSILKAIDRLKKDNQTPEDFLTDILNQKNNTFVSEFFEFAFNDKQEDKKKLEYAKKFYLGMLSQFFIQFERNMEGYEFLSLVFKPYFVDKINKTQSLKDLESIIGSIGDFEDNICLSNDPEISLQLLMNNIQNITTKNRLEAFCESYSKCLDNINDKMVGNRKLLVDLKKIFLNENLDSNVAIKNISLVVNLLTKLDKDPTNVQDNDFEGLSEVLSAYAKMLIQDKITNEDKVTNTFPLLSETLKFQCEASTLKGFSLKEKQNLMQCMISIAEGTFAKNAQSVDPNKNALKDYFWAHAEEIFKLNTKQFNATEAQEIYHLIEVEWQNPVKDDGNYFNLLFDAIDGLNLNDPDNLLTMFNNKDNFKNILALKNGKNDNEKEAAYKSILKSLVKQRLDQKGGFVAGAYLKCYEKQIDNNKITDESQKQIVSGVQDVLDENFQPDSNILIESIGDLDNNNLLGFWVSCQKAKKNPAEENKNEEKIIITINNQPIDNKNEKKDIDDKDIDDNDKILSELSDIFLDLLDNDNKKAKNKNEINTSNDNPTNVNKKDNLNLVDVTKKFVTSLYQPNEQNKSEKIIEANKSKDDKDIGNVLLQYFDTIGEDQPKSNSGESGGKISNYKIEHFYDLDDSQIIELLRDMKTWEDQLKPKLGKYGVVILKHQMHHFHDLDNNQKIKLLQCMKNLKHNKLTNDDLAYINLWYYKQNSADYFIKQLASIKLTIGEYSALEQAFRNYAASYANGTTNAAMPKEDIKSFIKNIGKQRIDDPEEKKKFAKAVSFLLKRQIEDLKSKYDSNDYNTIDAVTTEHKENWKNFIEELKSKNVITDDQFGQLTNEIDSAYNVSKIIAVGEWILAFLGSIITLGMLPKFNGGIRKTLHSPIKSRKTRYLIKSIESKGNNGNDNGIFHMLNKIANKTIPKQGSNIDNLSK